MGLEFRFEVLMPLFLFDKTFVHISVSLLKIGSVPRTVWLLGFSLGLIEARTLDFCPFLYCLPQSLSERWQLTFFRGPADRKTGQKVQLEMAIVWNEARSVDHLLLVLIPVLDL
jgi:hypothetical protein